MRHFHCSGCSWNREGPCMSYVLLPGPFCNMPQRICVIGEALHVYSPASIHPSYERRTLAELQRRWPSEYIYVVLSERSQTSALPRSWTGTLGFSAPSYHPYPSRSSPWSSLPSVPSLSTLVSTLRSTFRSTLSTLRSSLPITPADTTEVDITLLRTFSFIFFCQMGSTGNVAKD